MSCTHCVDDILRVLLTCFAEPKLSSFVDIFQVFPLVFVLELIVCRVDRWTSAILCMKCSEQTCVIQMMYS